MDREPFENVTDEPPGADRTGRAADRLFRRFAEMINSGELREGDTLPPEREIVEAYGVSRTVVREAVQALANRGLVEARPRFRPVVRRPSFDAAFETVDTVVGRLLAEPQGIRNLFETRIMIEVGLARQAALEATKADLQALKGALEANRAAIADSERFYETDKGFHAVLYQIPHNPVLMSIHKAYVTWLAPQWSKMPRLPDRNAHNYQAHKAIYDAILMRDPDGAEAASRAHLDDAWAQVRETFDFA